MIAVIVATGEAPEWHGLDKDLPVPLIPLCDRPFLQHVIEGLLQWQIRRVEVILSHLPEAVEAYFGDGVRWGCEIHYHLAAPHQDHYSLLRRVVGSGGDRVLLGSADTLPEFKAEMLAECGAGEPVAFFRPDQNGQPGSWTGWALLPAPAEGTAVSRDWVSKEWFEDLESGGSAGCRRATAGRELSVRSGTELLRSQREVLEETFQDIHLSGQQILPGIWVSRGVSLADSVQLLAPVFIGANCRIGPDAYLGPCTVISGNCIVGAHSAVVNSTICAGTYVGEGLDLDRVVVNQHYLVDLKAGTSFAAPEPFLFGSLTGHRLGLRVRCFLDRLLAAALLAILGPLAAIAVAVRACFQSSTLVRDEFAPSNRRVHPSSQTSYRLARILWDGRRVQTRAGRLLFEFTPGLLAVVKGQLALVGMKARHAAAIQALPDDWRAVYLKTKSGLISEADVLYGPHSSEDELYSSEAYYSATESFSRDLALLGRYLFAFPGRRADHAAIDNAGHAPEPSQVGKTIRDK